MALGSNAVIWKGSPSTAGVEMGRLDFAPQAVCTVQVLVCRAEDLARTACSTFPPRRKKSIPGDLPNKLGIRKMLVLKVVTNEKGEAWEKS